MLNKYEELNKRWKKGQVIGLDVIISKSNGVTPIDIMYVRNDYLTHSFRKEYSISYGNNMTLLALFDNYNDPWSEIQVNDRAPLNDDGFIICGEGEMGNEGFIVKTDINNDLIWMLYSTTSNPFMSINKINNNFYIQSSANFYIEMNALNDSITIVNEDIKNIFN